MQNKTIIQTDIDVGTQWGNAETLDFIRGVCIPSVKKYCIKYKYNYVLITESKFKEKFGDYNFFEKKSKHFAFERYFYLMNYDFPVYLDNDIYVFDEAKPLPEINGIMCSREPENKSSKIFHQANNISSNIPYYNSGVIMCDKENAKKICNYMDYRVANKIHAKGKNTDNMMLNEYLYDYKESINFNLLDSSWNFMPFLGGSQKKIIPNFYHFVGSGGKEVISFYLEFKKKVPEMNLEYFLNNAEINLPYSKDK